MYTAHRKMNNTAKIVRKILK